MYNSNLFYLSSTTLKRRITRLLWQIEHHAPLIVIQTEIKLIQEMYADWNSLI